MAVAGISWAGVVLQVMDMQPGTTSGVEALPVPTALGFLGAWGVMMTAMMLPSATPMIVIYDKVSRNLAKRERVIPTLLFAAIYLSIWLSLGVLVYMAGVGLNALAEASPAISNWLPYLVAALLVGTGAYQFTALKRACLRHCRTPLSFIMARWRSGYTGTVKLATAHATYCVGCCFALMAVLVAAGAMSLPWVLLIATIVFIEKLLPRGEPFGRLVGVVFVVLGLAIVLDPDFAAMVRGTAM